MQQGVHNDDGVLGRENLADVADCLQLGDKEFGLRGPDGNGERNKAPADEEQEVRRAVVEAGKKSSGPKFLPGEHDDRVAVGIAVIAAPELGMIQERLHGARRGHLNLGNLPTTVVCSHEQPLGEGADVESIAIE
jgi:hypothetical protein